MLLECIQSLWSTIPNFRCTIFLWILWLDFWSQKFSSQKFSIVTRVAMCCAMQLSASRQIASVCTCMFFHSKQIMNIKSLWYMSLLWRASRRIESLWHKTAINSERVIVISSFFWFVSLHTYKLLAQCELWAEQRVVRKVPLCAGNHK